MKRYYQKLVMIVALGVAALTGLIACGSMTTNANSDPRQAEDARITSQVRARLRHDPVFKFRNIQVATSNGKVQLSGFTSDPKEKQASEQVARKVDGVREVMNEIVVQ